MGGGGGFSSPVSIVKSVLGREERRDSGSSDILAEQRKEQQRVLDKQKAQTAKADKDRQRSQSLSAARSRQATIGKGKRSTLLTDGLQEAEETTQGRKPLLGL